LTLPLSFLNNLAAVSTNGGGPYCVAATANTNAAEVALVACLNSDFHTTFPDGNITWSVPIAPLTGPLKTFDGKCLDVPSGATQNGVKLQVWDCFAESPNQLFQTVGKQIKFSGTSKCLDLTDGNSTSGTPVRVSLNSTGWLAKLIYCRSNCGIASYPTKTPTKTGSLAVFKPHWYKLHFVNFCTTLLSTPDIIATLRIKFIVLANYD
jgi:hypothetical protein